MFNAYSQFTVLLVNILDNQVIRKALRNQKESIINFMGHYLEKCVNRKSHFNTYLICLQKNH